MLKLRTMVQGSAELSIGRTAARVKNERQEKVALQLIKAAKIEVLDGSDPVLGSEAFYVAFTSELATAMAADDGKWRRPYLSASPIFLDYAAWTMEDQPETQIECRHIGEDDNPSIPFGTTRHDLTIGGKNQTYGWYGDDRTKPWPRRRVNLLLRGSWYPSFRKAFGTGSLVVSRRIRVAGNWLSVECLEIPRDAMHVLGQIDPEALRIPKGKNEARIKLPSGLGTARTVEKRQPPLSFTEIDLDYQACRPKFVIHFTQDPLKGHR